MIGGLLRYEELACIQRGCDDLVENAAMKIVRAAAAGHGKVADPRILGRVIGADDLQFTKVVHVLDEIHGTIALDAVQALGDLTRRLAGSANVEYATLH